MMNRAELEVLLGQKLTDDQWQLNQQIFEELSAREWDETHQMDE